MKCRIPRSIKDNLRFLIIEVASQVSSLQSYMMGSVNVSAIDILDRSGYTFNLKVRIHNDCHNHLAQAGKNDTDTVVLKSFDSIAGNLDRIAELCRDCIQHIAKLKHRSCLLSDEYERLLDKLALSISLIEQANKDSDSQLALKIGAVEQTLTQACDQLLNQYTLSLKNKKNTEDLIASLFVAQSVKHMGAAILKISEAILSGNLGQAINIDRYHSLNEFAVQLAQHQKPSSLVVESIAETRSGGAVSGISKAGKNEIIAIFKDGKKRKLKEEKQSVAVWHEKFPGLAPKILSYNKSGESAALLIEHLDGQTFESLLLTGDRELQDEAFMQLCVTLQSVWKKTRKKKPVAARYMQQLQCRIADIYAIHPEFSRAQAHICGYNVTAFNTLIKQVDRLESKLDAPFSVYIHGDFNTDNIIYDVQQKKINFIDLHRSCYMDYVQDISVFMVSNYRLHVLDQAIRKRALDLTLDVYRFSAAFADNSNDNTFDFRLALGLARSFATSTRFILDKTLATDMYLRAVYLLEQLVAAGLKKPQHYQLPIREIFLG